jgi:hypothetical protein
MNMYFEKNNKTYCRISNEPKLFHIRVLLRIEDSVAGTLLCVPSVGEYVVSLLVHDTLLGLVLTKHLRTRVPAFFLYYVGVFFSATMTQGVGATVNGKRSTVQPWKMKRVLESKATGDKALLAKRPKQHSKCVSFCRLVLCVCMDACGQIFQCSMVE